MSGARPPAGFRRIDEPGATLVARDDVAEAIREAFRAAPADRRSLHGFASRVEGARALAGRETAWAIPLGGIRVVVRHNRHGGALRGLTGDLFANPTRAPRELELSRAVTAQGIATPAVVAYAVYPAFGLLARSDVVTQEVTGGADLGALLAGSQPGDARRIAAWRATRQLLERLAERGIRHHDLNAKNVLIANDTAWMLDVDRVELGLARAQADVANRMRLLRSLEKWRATRGLRLEPGELDLLRKDSRIERK